MTNLLLADLDIGDLEAEKFCAFCVLKRTGVFSPEVVAFHLEAKTARSVKNRAKRSRQIDDQALSGANSVPL